MHGSGDLTLLVSAITLCLCNVLSVILNRLVVVISISAGKVDQCSYRLLQHHIISSPIAPVSLLVTGFLDLIISTMSLCAFGRVW